MNNCTECKNFLDINSITDNTSYRKWMLLNHPDKFRKFGNTDSRYINATEHTKKASDCFPKWYGTGLQKICGTFGDLDMPTTFEKKNSLLLDASRTGDIRIVKELIALGVDVNIQNSIGETALIISVMKNHLYIVNLLLTAKANPNIKDSYRNTALIYAAYNTKDDINIVNALIKAGAELNYKNSSGDTPLILATRKKINIDIVNSLVEAGSNVNIQNNDGMTALMYAARGRDISEVNILLEGGSNINLQNNKGQTALDIAIEKNLSVDIINIISLKSKRTDAGYKRKKSGGRKKSTGGKKSGIRKSAGRKKSGGRKSARRKKSGGRK